MQSNTAIPQPHRAMVIKLCAAAALVGMLAVGAGRAWAQADASIAAQSAHGQHQRGAHHQRMGPGMAGAMLAERALDAVGASAEQKSRVREIFESARTDLRAGQPARETTRTQMLALLAAPQIDRAGAEALRQQELAGHDAASKRMLQAMLDAQAVLTPEQRQKLAERIKAHRVKTDQHQHHPRERRTPDAPRS